MIVAQIERQELESILAGYHGNAVFSQKLEQSVRDEDFLRVLANYVEFNSVFGGGVLNLAGEVAVRQDIFRDTNISVVLGDRSFVIAKGIFYAAIDELGDRNTPHKKTHRQLAQETLAETASFLGYDVRALDLMVHPITYEAMQKVKDGYGLNQPMDATKLFKAMGFHLGSERLADDEFCILDNYLHLRRRDLVYHLSRIDSYYWIKVHTTVEAEHFDAGLKAANSALFFYAEKEGRNRMKDAILTGFKEFAQVQEDFMKGLQGA